MTKAAGSPVPGPARPRVGGASDAPSAERPNYPKPTAQVAPYVDVLGPWLTIRFLLTFGGAELYLPTEPGTHTRLVALVGQDKARQLAASAHLLQRRVPLAKRWLAGYLRAEGNSSAQIARTLRASDTSVRKWLKD